MNKLALPFALTLLLLSGCANLGYYAQAVGGHLQVMGAARPIGDLLHDPAADPDLRKRLADVAAIRAFASRELDLPDNRSYNTYADLGRPFVVWNVFAAPEFSVEPEQWCLLFAGCFNYRGYYRREDAECFADELQREGHDTYVGGVPAYSTLGMFDDPVLNTFLRFGSLEVARILFHELAHQVLYVPGDTIFNESFASAVEAEGLRRWLAYRANAEQYQAYREQQRRRTQFLQLVADYRDKLRALYATPQPADVMRQAKQEMVAQMKQDYARLKSSWGGYGGYDKWFEPDFNNAKMAALGLYHQLAPAFETLLANEDHDLLKFYRRAAALSTLPKEERTALLKGLIPEHPNGENGGN